MTIREAMNSDEDFRNVVTIVAKVSEVEISDLFSGRRNQELTDARWIAVQLLKEMGYYTSRICILTGLSSRHVNRILTEIDTRRGSGWRTMRRNLAECKTALGLTSDV